MTIPFVHLVNVSTNSLVTHLFFARTAPIFHSDRILSFFEEALCASYEVMRNYHLGPEFQCRVVKLPRARTNTEMHHVFREDSDCIHTL